jgi:hypothetical protein
MGKKIRPVIGCNEGRDTHPHIYTYLADTLKSVSARAGGSHRTAAARLCWLYPQTSDLQISLVTSST